MYKNEWVYSSSKTEKAKTIRIGSIRVVLDDITLIGKSDWRTEVVSRTDGQPKIGDRKIVMTGISAEKPVFVVGYLSKDTIDSGDIFLLSAYSGNKTIDEIRESRWFSRSVIFIILFTGLIISIRPFRQILGGSDNAFLKTVSSVNYFVWIVLFFILSILTARLSVNLIEGIILIYLVLFVCALVGVVKNNSRHMKL